MLFKPIKLTYLIHFPSTHISTSHFSLIKYTSGNKHTYIQSGEFLNLVYDE